MLAETRRRPYYRTWIPSAADERVIEAFPDGQKKVVEYHLNGEMAGCRHFEPSAELSWERPIRSGKLHGTVYEWSGRGKLLSSEPYRDGLPHGIARQWGNDGRLIGAYAMSRGSGTDLWWQEYHDGTVELAEVHPKEDGDLHGFQWWFSAGTLWWERHWWYGLVHGIERQWNRHGTLSRGYPKYWIHGEAVNKRQYIRAALHDQSLPRFRIEENAPQRALPSEIERVLHGLPQT